MTNLINCGTCGYPLTPEERTSLIERNGVMVKPAPVQELALVTAAQRQSARSAWVHATEWRGLTDEEILEAAGIDGADTWLFETAYAIEAKLKEKNA